MPQLSKVQSRFEINLTIPATGQVFRGAIDEPPQGEPPALRFNIPRRVLRVQLPSIAAIGQLVTTPAGVEFILGYHGLSESRDTTLFKAFRLFTVTHRLSWSRRVLATHPVSGVAVDTAPTSLGMIPGVLEPDRQTYDKGISQTFPTYNFVTNAAVLVDDEVDGKKVVRADQELGLTLCELQ